MDIMGNLQFLSTGKTKKAQETVLLMLETNLGDKLRPDLHSLELFPQSDPAIHGLSLPKLFFKPIRGYVLVNPNSS